MDKGTIVWIDDNADVTYAVVKPLERVGYKIVTMRELGEVRSRIDELRSATLVILDLIFPDGTRNDPYPGLTLLREMRSEHAIQTPVLLLSVVGRDKIGDQISDLDVRAVCRKPISPWDLREKVGECLALQGPWEERSP